MITYFIAMGKGIPAVDETTLESICQLILDGVNRKYYNDISTNYYNVLGGIDVEGIFSPCEYVDRAIMATTYCRLKDAVNSNTAGSYEHAQGDLADAIPQSGKGG